MDTTMSTKEVAKNRILNKISFPDSIKKNIID